jgi:NAD(P)-dependent dehydrogenase (short-subunit alcohol dehydrogenase family)
MVLNGINGRVAVVTGAAGTIGSAMCRRLAREGARIVAVDVDGDGTSRVAAALDGDAIGVTADVAAESGVARYVDAALEAYGHIDMFCDNAGIEGAVAPLAAMSVDDFDRVIAVNVRGVFLGLRAVMGHMSTHGGGSIVVTSSVAGIRGSAGVGAYVASKHAVIGLVRTAAIEGAAAGIRVNAILPGVVEGRMMRELEEGMGALAGLDGPAVREQLLMRVPMRRYASGDDIAAVTAWLLSDDAAYVSGALHVVDGALSAQP